jgi:hypothetical protein
MWVRGRAPTWQGEVVEVPVPAPGGNDIRQCRIAQRGRGKRYAHHMGSVRRALLLQLLQQAQCAQLGHCTAQ